MKKNQSVWVVNELLKYGKVSRNKALNYYISRLGAIIHDLVQDGWKFEDTKQDKQTGRGRFVKTKYGQDYVYFLVSSPKK
jgi:hypothetical protein